MDCTDIVNRDICLAFEVKRECRSACGPPFCLQPECREQKRPPSLALFLVYQLFGVGVQKKLWRRSALLTERVRICVWMPSEFPSIAFLREGKYHKYTAPRDLDTLESWWAHTLAGIARFMLFGWMCTWL